MSSAANDKTQRPLHIVFLCDEYPPCRHGGVGTMTQILARAMARRGQHVTVVGVLRSTADPLGEEIVARHESEDPSDGEESALVRVLRLRQHRSLLPDALMRALQVDRELRQLHEHRPIDLVEGPEIFHGGAIGRRPWKRLIRMNGGHHFFSHSAGQALNARRAWLERRSFRKADHLCAVSGWVAERTRELLHLGARDITLIPNPVDTDQFSPGPPPATTPGRIVFAGSLTAKKGVFELIDAFIRIADKFEHAGLVLCGRDTHQDGRSVRQLLIERLPESLRGRVEFLGAVPHHELADVLRSAEILTYPSHMEAMPLAWLEGLSLGKPILASNTGPGPEVIEHERTGLLCDPHDPDQIAAGLSRLLGEQALRHRLGAAARCEALERFSIDRLAQRNLDYYRRITARRP